jgi:4-diphosphocytidyl-2-C-methyl-D-erythritol kinase
MKFICPAKINLFLKVLGKGSDGYHKLESLFAFTDLVDELEVVKSEQFNIEISGEFAQLLDPKKNLFLTIFKYFSEEFNIDDNLHIKVKKNIPIGGGLGGGSSNAASFMMALNNIFELNLSKERLQEISLKFGSDIAFFFEDRASIIKGRGEKIDNFPEFKALSALLVNPKIHLSTGDIFDNLGQNYSDEIDTAKLLKRDVFDLTESLANDLEASAIRAAPDIKVIIENLKNNGAEISKMSGSGSSCFGVFLNEDDLEHALDFFTEKFPDFFVRKIKICSGRIT